MATHTIDEATPTLTDMLGSRKLIILAGSGISVPAPSNLPTWDGVLLEIAQFCREQLFSIFTPDDEFREIVNQADQYVKSDPLRVASVLKQKLVEVDRRADIRVENTIMDWLTRRLTSRPNRNHELIVSTDFPYVLTTNYDDLLEEAARTSGHGDLCFRSFSFTDPRPLAESIFEEKPAIIHLHGKLRDITLKDYVFTSQDYIRIKRRHPGFDTLISSLLVRYGLLFVGYGASDPHLEEVLEDFVYDLDLWEREPRRPRFFLTMKEDKVNLFFDRYKHAFLTDVITLPDYADLTTLLERLCAAAPRSGATRPG